MAYLRRHWRATALQAALLGVCILVLTLGLVTWGEGQASAQEAAETLETETTAAVDPVIYDHVQTLRQELALTTADLAAMGLTGAEAESLLTSIRGWVEANQARLEAQDQAQRQAEADLREAMRQVRIGPRPRTEPIIRSLPSLESGLAEATSQTQRLHDELKQQVESRLASGGKQVWQAALSNRDLPDRYRYVPAVSESQMDEIGDMARRRQLTDQPRSVTSADTALSTSQRAAAEVAELNLVERMAEVQAAEDKVLPAPSEEAQAAAEVEAAR